MKYQITFLPHGESLVQEGVELEKIGEMKDKSDTKIQQQLTNPENLNIQELDNLIFQEKERNFK